MDVAVLRRRKPWRHRRPAEPMTIMSRITEATMTPQRRIARTVPSPPLAPGFVGPGHLAAQLVAQEDFAVNDPFIMLMDDHLDIGERPVGGAHPHAGFETVTLLLEGAIHD